MNTADQIAALATAQNIAAYAATQDKFLLVDGLLMDNGIARSTANREELENLLDQEA